MKETVVTLVIGTRSMFAEGVVATLERERYYVEERSPAIHKLRLEDYASAKRLLFMFIQMGKIDTQSIGHEITAVRTFLPQAKIVLVRDDVAFVGERLCDIDCDAYIQCPLEPQALLSVIDLVFSMPCRLLVMPSPDPHGLTAGEFNSSPGETPDPAAEEVFLPVNMVGATSLLSKRECEILSGLSRGEANKHIARTLEISEATVKAHVRSILQKLGAENRTQAAVKLLEGTMRSELPPNGAAPAIPGTTP